MCFEVVIVVLDFELKVIVFVCEWKWYCEEEIIFVKVNGVFILVDLDNFYFID